MKDVKTITGEVFTYQNHCELAYLIWIRWGRSYRDSAAAWRRLFQNNCDDDDFAKLIIDKLTS